MSDQPESKPETKPEFPPVDPATLRVETDNRGRLYVVREGFENQQILVRRAFPWSMPTQFISLRTRDGNELAMLESLEAVPAEAREQITLCLQAETFIPKIRRIEKIDLEYGYQLWDIETDAGPLQLRVQEREDIRFLTDTRFSVKDASGNLYEIENALTLDEQSRRELARVV